MRNLVARLFRALKRLDRNEADRAELLSGRPSRVYQLAFAIIAISVVITWLPLFGATVMRWYKLQPEILLKEPDLRVHYGSSPHPCAEIASDDMDCIVNATNPLLWQQGKPRFSGKHEADVKKRLWHDFWLGLTIDPDTLADARQQGATQLLLSHLYSSYRIWINGVFVKAGQGASDPIPILVQLNSTDLRSREPLRVAIQVQYDDDHIPPDHFCENLPLGFARPDTADQFVFMMRFWECGRPVALFLAFSLLALLFYFLWQPSPNKQEYLFMALFCLTAASWEARWIDFLQRQIEHTAALAIGLSNRTALSGFALLVGLSFARLTPRLLRSTTIVTLGLATAMPFLFITVESRMQMRMFMIQTLTPLAFFLGGLACLYQGYAIWSASRGGAKLPVRMRRLLLFGGGLVTAAIYYYLDSHKLIVTSPRTFWRGLELLVFMIYFAAIALKEYAEDEQLVKKAPVSEYHRRPVLPEKINGALFVADLKSSEPFYKQRAVSRSVDLVSMWRSQVYASALKHGGTIVNRKGDEVIIFFDEEKSPDALSVALTACREITEVSRLLSEEFTRQGVMPADAKGFFFRASVALGSIKPTWEEMSGHREAYWEEAGNSSPFVEAARTLEMERKAPGTAKDKTLLVLREDAAAALVARKPELASSFTSRDFVSKDKHGAEYHIAVYEPGETIATVTPIARAAA